LDPLGDVPREADGSSRAETAEPTKATITGKPRPAPLRSLARTSSSSSRALLVHDIQACFDLGES